MTELYPCLTHLQIINANGAYIQQFQNLKRKLYSCNVNIYFHQKCLRMHATMPPISTMFESLKAMNTMVNSVA